MDRQQAKKLLCESAGAKAALDQEESKNSKITAAGIGAPLCPEDAEGLPDTIGTEVRSGQREEQRKRTAQNKITDIAQRRGRRIKSACPLF